MKTIIAISVILCLNLILKAQCSFDPIINGELILCPNSTATLSTQSFDAYQWYKREYSEPNSSPIPGDTLQTISISSTNDVLYYFSVEATLDGCTEFSPEVLVDGWTFLPVTVISTGDFTIGNNGEAIVCMGDTMYFTLNLPYNTNITWYKNGSPISGETLTKLPVTSAGQYTVTGAPDICPDYIQSLGLTLEVLFIECSSGTKEGLLEEENVIIYPNPATGQVSIESEDEEIHGVVFFNSLGQLIHQEIILDHKKSIDISGFDEGVYLIEISIETRKVFHKLIMH